jgi:probable FeS assembly SUF system protein SufT
MSTEKPIILRRDCRAVMIPSGEAVSLSAGSAVWLTQALGGGFTVMTDHGYSVRIDGQDGDALGLEGDAAFQAGVATGVVTNGSIEDRVWQQLRSCFDPEIPVNIVELGLIYDCRIDTLADDRYRVVVRFTLTSPGCGMGQFLKEDMRKKLLSIAGVYEADVELVWEPAWNQSMISPSAKQQLGIV